MVLKKIALFTFVALIGSGCSYKISSTEEFAALDERLVELEKKISHSLSQEFQAQKNYQNEQLETLCKASQVEHNQKLESLTEELKNLKDFLKNREQPKPKQQEASKKKSTLQVATLPNEAIKSNKEKFIVGRVERVLINPPGILMEARVDTGAQTSSINAKNITRFERDGDKWVRFALVDEKSQESHIIERRVVRTAKIVQSSLDDGFEKRVVVLLQITIGDKKELSEFTLTSREHMTYSVLIGRNFLQDLMVVDVGGKYLAPLQTEEKKETK